MPKVTIEPPKEAGVVRIGVFGPDGHVLVQPRLVLPTGTFEFDAPKPGTYTASLESLGTGQVLWNFPVASDNSMLQAPRLDSLRLQRSQSAGARPIVPVSGEIAAIELGEDGPLVPAPVRPAPAAATAPAAPTLNTQAEARRDYELALQVGNRSALNAFLAQYPDGFYASLAKLQLDKIAGADHLQTLPNILQTHAVASASRSDDGNLSAGSTMSFNPSPGAAYSLGLSYDSQPLRYGGWRPFAESIVKTRRTDSGDVEVVFDRGDKLPTANSGARLRLSFAIEANRVQRILVPLFAGGVKVVLRTMEAPYLSSDTLSIVPARPETHALLQALTSNSTEIATGIWNEIGHGPAHLARYASADISDDPWVSVAVGVLMLRLGWLHHNDYWLEELARNHPWIADASILAAHQRLAQTPPDVDGAIEHLQQARRVGAVYFFEANRLQGDLLVALAADGPDEIHRGLAAVELAHWRTNLANQVQVGAFFSWLMTRGARTRGGLDQRYSTILDSGRLTRQNRHVDVLSSLSVIDAAGASRVAGAVRRHEPVRLVAKGKLGSAKLAQQVAISGTIFADGRSMSAAQLRLRRGGEVLLVTQRDVSSEQLILEFAKARIDGVDYPLKEMSDVAIINELRAFDSPIVWVVIGLRWKKARAAFEAVALLGKDGIEIHVSRIHGR
ncbi:hypothetical protein HAP41_0000049490 (plasmid) [Bradyrhizobium barranii subsp. apii]|uniref:Uncharacterized protein n=1 Tax=Bradyrhizobium barranii subsp. apii TaxID=2819348 RepID=A0A8T5VWH5_9BRAD|nr:hypothetical protein [Bradyrhizobium barranii]UPT92346.1 hypothetical protein HAP41_0000049490 [Bradyrhizobium barranii subsp. apii]